MGETQIKIVVYEEFRVRPISSTRFTSNLNFQYMNESKKSTGTLDNIAHTFNRLSLLDNIRWLVTQWEQKSAKAFPTLLEIRDGIIFESNLRLSSEDEKLQHELIWRKLFSQEKRLQWQALEDPSYESVTQILYIYSLETFLPEALNKATIEKDASKIATLGPFAKVLQ